MFVPFGRYSYSEQLTYVSFILYHLRSKVRGLAHRSNSNNLLVVGFELMTFGSIVQQLTTVPPQS